MSTKKSAGKVGKQDVRIKMQFDSSATADYNYRTDIDRRRKLSHKLRPTVMSAVLRSNFPHPKTGE